jgi:alpha-L-fucosidase
VDRVRLAEDVRHGQQVEGFVIETHGGDGWTKVAGAGTVGASRILLLPAPVRARRWRVRVTASRAAVRIAEFGLYRSEV